MLGKGNKQDDVTKCNALEKGGTGWHMTSVMMVKEGL